MTVIVAVTDGTRVCMACDSQGTNSSGAIATLARPKIASCKGRVFGFSGELDAADYVSRVLPDVFAALDDAPVDEQASYAYRLLWEYLDQRKRLRVDQGASEVPGCLILAHRSQFAIVESSGGVLTIDGDWWAVGSGAAEARGAMFVAERAEHSQAHLIARAGVEAAIELDSGCGPPIRLLWTEP